MYVGRQQCTNYEHGASRDKRANIITAVLRLLFPAALFGLLWAHGGGQSRTTFSWYCQDASVGPGWAATRHQLPPLWVDKVDGVEEDVRLIQLKRETLLRSANVCTTRME